MRWQDRSPRDRAVVRYLLVLAATVTVVAVAAGHRFADNPRRPIAQAGTDVMDQLYADVRAGRRDLPSDIEPVADGVLGVVTDGGRWALASEVDGTCYAMWWGADGRRHVRTVPPLLSCNPRVGSSDEPGTVARSALSADADDPDANWDVVLPPARIVAVWWIPLVLVAWGVGLSASTRLVAVLVTRGSLLRAGRAGRT